MRPEDKGRERLSGFPVKGEAARLFFALWPDGEVRLALAALAKDLCRECGGRMVRASNIHLTLAFLGDVPLERISQLADAAGTMRTLTFDLAIDTQGYWRHNRILWAGAKACPPALRALALGLGEVRKTFGLAQDTREYAPHITLVRDALPHPE